jgi:hypothetical protein
VLVEVIWRLADHDKVLCFLFLLFLCVSVDDDVKRAGIESSQLLRSVHQAVKILYNSGSKMA